MNVCFGIYTNKVMATTCVSTAPSPHADIQVNHTHTNLLENPGFTFRVRLKVPFHSSLAKLQVEEG